MRGRVALVAIVAAAAVLRLATAGRLPLSGDEAYHWEWSRHLAWAYYDHPGMTGWCIWLGEFLLPGAGELAVRLPAIVGSLVAALLAWGFARDVARTLRVDADAAVVDRAGLLAATLVTFMPLPAALAVYMSTDAPLLPACIGLAWAAFAAAERGKTRAWVGLGLALGLAISTKFLVLPLVLGACAWFVFSPAGRTRLRGFGPWLALAVAGLVTLPLWWWNATHDWMTLRFNFVIRQRNQDASAWEPLVFLGGQLGVLTPGVAVLGLIATVRRLRAPSVGARLVGWMSLLTLGAFLAMSLRREIGVHWTMPAWGIALVLLAVSVAVREAWTRSTWSRVGWWLSWLLAAVVLLAAHSFAVAPEWFARQDFVAGQPAKVVRPLFGWREIGREVDERLVAMRSAQRSAGEERGVFALSDQYGVAAAVAFYAPSHPRVHLWSAARHGRNYEFWDDWPALAGQDAILISKRPVADDVARTLAARFAQVDPAVEFPIVVEGRHAHQFYVIVARGFDGARPFPPP